MTTTNEILSSDDNDTTSASNAIDQMISMSMLDHADPNSDQTTTNRANWSPRYINRNEPLFEILVHA